MAAFFAAAFLMPYRAALKHADTLSVMTATFVSAAALNGALALVSNRRGPRRWDATTLRTALGLGALTIVGNGGIALALPTIGAGMVSVVLKSQVLLTPLLALAFLAETASRRLWVGALVALCGFVWPQLMSGDWAAVGAGYAYAFAAALGFALMQILTRRVITEIDLSSVNVLRLMCAVFALQFLEAGREAWRLPTKVWVLAAAAGLLGPVFSRLSLMLALRDLSPSVTAVVALVGPVFAFGLGYLAFGERPSPSELGGAGLILLGVSWVILPSLRRNRSPMPDRSRPPCRTG